MRRGQWFILAVTSLLLSGTFYYQMVSDSRSFSLARELATEGTSNLEIITSLAYRYTFDLATIFLLVSMALLICGLLEK